MCSTWRKERAGSERVADLMKHERCAWLKVVSAILLTLVVPVQGADWPQWGGRDERNFVSQEKGIPASFSPARKEDKERGIKAAPAKNLKWVAKLGSKTYGNPTVSGGRVFIGTNDASLKDPRLRKSRGGMVMCLDEATGTRLWQLPIPAMKTKERKFNYDDMNLGVCSAPAVDGNRVYVVGNRCDVLCLDVEGQANGNDGAFQDEGQYMVGPGTLPAKPGRFEQWPKPPKAVKVEPRDADIVWRFDMLRQPLDVWPQDAADCSILVHGDYLYVCTSNGVDRSHRYRPSPNAPDIIVLDKKTGRLVAGNDHPIGNAIFHGEWSSPSLARLKDRALVLWGGGDGFCYAFDPKPVPGKGGNLGILKTVWRFDCNPPHNKYRDGKLLPYNKNREGPSEIIGTPVSCEGRVFVTVGQDSRHGPGPGCMSCIDPTQTGDVTETARIWQYFDLGRSFSTPSVVGDLVFVVDYGGKVHCLDAKTGRPHWTHDLKAHVWGSTFAVDGKVFVGDEKGKLTVFACDKEKKVLATMTFDVPLYATPIAANGVLFVTTETHLYAVCADKP